MGLKLAAGAGGAAAGCYGLYQVRQAVMSSSAAGAAATSLPGPEMHPAHTQRLNSAPEFNQFVKANVAAGKTVFVRWIHSPA